MPVIKAAEEGDSGAGAGTAGLLQVDRSTLAEMERAGAGAVGEGGGGGGAPSATTTTTAAPAAAIATTRQMPFAAKVLPPLVVTQSRRALLDFEKSLPVAMKTKVHKQTISPSRNSLGERTRRSALEGNKDVDALAAIGPRFSFHFESRSEKWERLRGKQKLEAIPGQIAEM